VIEGVLDGGITVSGDIEAPGVCSARTHVRLGTVSAKDRQPEESTEGRGGEQGLSLEPRVVPAILEPTTRSITSRAIGTTGSAACSVN
jgi:hypothetical protein